MIYRNKNSVYYKLIVSWISLLLYFCPAYNQETQAPANDSLWLKQGSTLVINKKKIKIKSDTLIIVPRGTDYDIEPGNDKFYRNLKQRAKNNFWTRELHNIILSEQTKVNNTDSLKSFPSSEPFEPYYNKTIRNITIKQLPVFGPSISDTLTKPTTFFERTANRLHFQTKKFLIEKNLLFSSNDLVNPDILADNERIIRELPYIEDAKIEIIPLKNDSNSIDIIVIVKDNWSMAFNLNIEKVQTGSLDIMNKNIFGLGQETKNSFLWDKRKRPGTGYEGMYIIHNIGNSFIKGNLTYNKSFGSQTLSLNLNREFFTPNIKYAGGFTFKNVQSDIHYFSAAPPEFFPLEYNEYEIWTGRSFLLTGIDKRRTRQNLTFAGKAIINKFYQRPIVTPTSYYNLQNKTLFLFSAIYTQQNYYKSSLIYNFGRTEDIPVGLEVSSTVGYEVNEFFNRKYLGSSIATGKFLGRFGYLSTSLTLSSFFNNNVPEQGILNTDLTYFTNLFVVNRYNFRQFITINLTKGYNRFFREFITMNDKLGISGYKNDSVYGTQRINVKWETVCFTPWKIYDFKFVLFIHGDHTWLSNAGESLFYGSPYSGLGFGIRIRNERLVFNTFQFRISFYPNIPPGSIINTVKISGEPVFNPVDFSPKEPKLSEFR